MTFSFRPATAFWVALFLASCAPMPETETPSDLPPETGGLRPGEVPLPPQPETVVVTEPVVIIEESLVTEEAVVVMEEASIETIDSDIEAGEYSEVTLFFATNRELLDTFDPDAPTTMFSNNNAVNVTYGTATVSIPDTHQAGEIESQSWIESILFTANPDDFVLLQDLTPRSKENTFALVDQILQEENAILLYIHGFNTSMEKAALRSGQMTFDLKWNGPSFFFSWPSQANGLLYTVDQTMAERSERALIEVLTELTAREEAERIVVIAHSMGTHVLTQSLLRFHAANPEAARRLTSIVLAAPDIDADIFINDIVPVFEDMPQTQVSLYASSNDIALQASHAVNGFARIGDTEFGDDDLSPVSMIDASEAESNFFEHTYYGDNPRIIDDIGGFIRDQLAPIDRPTLVGVPNPDGPTWKIVVR